MLTPPVLCPTTVASPVPFPTIVSTAYVTKYDRLLLAQALRLDVAIAHGDVISTEISKRDTFCLNLADYLRETATAACSP